MVDLGLGKNMVRSARFWAQAADLQQIHRNKAIPPERLLYGAENDL
jgi:hypothetical protein